MSSQGYVRHERVYRSSNCTSFADGWSWNEMESKERRSMEAGANHRLTFMGKKRFRLGSTCGSPTPTGRDIPQHRASSHGLSDWQCQIVDESYPVSYRTVPGRLGIRDRHRSQRQILESLGEDPESDSYAEGFPPKSQTFWTSSSHPKRDDEEDES